MLAVLLVVGAVALVVGAGLTWWTQTHLDSLAGSVTIKAKGSQTDALLIPVALLALAGFGATLATTGRLRRLVGVVLVLGGSWAATLAIIGLWQAPASLHTDLTRPPLSSAPPQLHPAAALVAALGGLLVALAGVLVVSGLGARRALGARYDAPTGRRMPAVVPTSLAVDSDPEGAAGWWKALDAGQDPTATVATVAASADDTDPDPVAERGPSAAVDGTRLPSAVDPGVSDDVTRGV
jgi:uncharacterized membrane protein (TIGR02234 family)